MKPVSAGVWRITSGRVKVGSVWAMTVGENAGKFQARIGTETEIGYSPEAVFRAVASRCLGFRDEADLRAHNRQVRAQRRAHRADARYLLNDYLSQSTMEGRMDALDRMFGFTKK